MTRKFTLLPFRGAFGLFSVKRVKPGHFSRIGDCKIRNCGIFTLCFNDSQVPPVISRRGSDDQVLLGFHGKEEALKENIVCEEFPGLHVAPVSRE